MRRWTLAIIALGLAPIAQAQESAPLMTPRDLMQIPVEKPDHVLRYGKEASQYGELRIPAGKGPHPVVVLIHGGCWRTIADAKSIGAMADAFKKAGIATWNIEYRRLPEAGSGWPGTYRDTGAAIDYLRTIAPRYKLDLNRLVFVGHSAGAHLAHWAAGRSRLKPSSDLYMANPLIPKGIINLAGKMDMAANFEGYEKECGVPVIRQLLGGVPEQVPQRYADSSPSALLPLGVRQVMIWGEHENYVPQPQVEDYVVKAQQAGDDARLILLEDAGHFEIASPRTAAWPVLLSNVEMLLKP